MIDEEKTITADDLDEEIEKKIDFFYNNTDLLDQRIIYGKSLNITSVAKMYHVCIESGLLPQLMHAIVNYNNGNKKDSGDNLVIVRMAPSLEPVNKYLYLSLCTQNFLKVQEFCSRHITFHNNIMLTTSKENMTQYLNYLIIERLIPFKSIKIKEKSTGSYGFTPVYSITFDGDDK